MTGIPLADAGAAAYHLTPVGHIALSEQRALWDQFSAAVTALLKRRTWPATA